MPSLDDRTKEVLEDARKAEAPIVELPMRIVEGQEMIDAIDEAQVLMDTTNTRPRYVDGRMFIDQKAITAMGESALITWEIPPDQDDDPDDEPKAIPVKMRIGTRDSGMKDWARFSGTVSRQGNSLGIIMTRELAAMGVGKGAVLDVFLRIPRPEYDEDGGKPALPTMEDY